MGPVTSDFKYYAAGLTGIPALFHMLNRNRLLVLAYHGIYDGPKRINLLPETFVHADDMVAQLKHIKKRYNVVRPEDLVDSLERGLVLPPDSALVTFDDGYESFSRLAAPVLKLLQIKPIVFISTRYMDRHEPFWFDMLWYFIRCSASGGIEWLCRTLNVDNANKNRELIKGLVFDRIKRMPLENRDDLINQLTNRITEQDGPYLSTVSLFLPMSYEQARRLSDNYDTCFGGHTHSHTILSAINEQEAAEEIRVNKEKIEQNLNKTCLFFAYPNGSEKDFNEVHKDILLKKGYRLAFSLTQRRSIINDDPFNISRIHVAPEDSIKSLNFRFSGAGILIGH
jgi:peptidoglycan/xylan/chitin deacetylase (PgdA/CDA1 family)